MKTATIVLCVFVAGLLAGGLPTNFDARQQWNYCNYTILDQGNCGSCWAFASVESFADRLCITGEAPSGTIISPEPILECSNSSCDGGVAQTAWAFLISDGDTTCTKECSKGCAPYDSYLGKTPKCNKGKCDDGSKWPETYFAASFEYLPAGSKNDEQFQTALYNNGPLLTCFEVFSNFYTFFDDHPDGIYDSASGNFVGGHCVKLIGWGHEDSTDYWLLANSWGPDWGDNGYFKMKRGKDLCEVEDTVGQGFTPKQAAEMKKELGGSREDNRKLIGGGRWVRQDETKLEHLEEAVEAGLTLVGEKIEKKLTFLSVDNVETQVVAGMNIKMEVKTTGGLGIAIKLFRDLRFEYHLVDFHLLF